jgi:hypothetical protein
MIEYNDQLVLQRGDGSASASEAHISQTPSADGELRSRVPQCRTHEDMRRQQNCPFI